MRTPKHEMELRRRLASLDVKAAAKRLRDYKLNCFLCDKNTHSLYFLRRHLVFHHYKYRLKERLLARDVVGKPQPTCGDCDMTIPHESSWVLHVGLGHWDAHMAEMLPKKLAKALRRLRFRTKEIKAALRRREQRRKERIENRQRQALLSNEPATSAAGAAAIAVPPDEGPERDASRTEDENGDKRPLERGDQRSMSTENPTEQEPAGEKPKTPIILNMNKRKARRMDEPMIAESILKPRDEDNGAQPALPDPKPSLHFKEVMYRGEPAISVISDDEDDEDDVVNVRRALDEANSFLPTKAATRIESRPESELESEDDADSSQSISNSPPPKRGKYERKGVSDNESSDEENPDAEFSDENAYDEFFKENTNAEYSEENTNAKASAEDIVSDTEREDKSPPASQRGDAPSPEEKASTSTVCQKSCAVGKSSPKEGNSTGGHSEASDRERCLEEKVFQLQRELEASNKAFSQQNEIKQKELVSANRVNIEQLEAKEAELVAAKATIKRLEEANRKDLVASKATIERLEAIRKELVAARKATFEQLENKQRKLEVSNKLITEQLDVKQKELAASNATVERLEANQKKLEASNKVFGEQLAAKQKVIVVSIATINALEKEKKAATKQAARLKKQLRFKDGRIHELETKEAAARRVDAEAKVKNEKAFREEAEVKLKAERACREDAEAKLKTEKAFREDAEAKLKNDKAFREDAEAKLKTEKAFREDAEAKLKIEKASRMQAEQNALAESQRASDVLLAERAERQRDRDTFEAELAAERNRVMSLNIALATEKEKRRPGILTCPTCYDQRTRTPSPTRERQSRAKRRAERLWSDTTPNSKLPVLTEQDKEDVKKICLVEGEKAAAEELYSGNGFSITRSAFKRLREPLIGLEENVADAYLSLIAKSSKGKDKVFAFRVESTRALIYPADIDGDDHPATAAALFTDADKDIFRFRYLLFPLRYGSGMWRMIVVDQRRRRIVQFDPDRRKSANMTAMETVATLVKRQHFLRRGKRNDRDFKLFNAKRCPKVLHDDSDLSPSYGVMAVMCAKYYLMNQKPVFKEKDVPLLRETMMLELFTKTLKDWDPSAKDESSANAKEA